MSMTCDIYAISASDMERLQSNPSCFAELVRSGNPNVTSTSLEKAWHGIHYLLTGEASDGDGPLAFIVAGGTEIDDSDDGYGPARLFTPHETQQINSAISPISDDDLWSQFDPDAMNSEGIYPQIWDEEEADLKDEYTMYFQGVKQLIAGAAANGSGILVSLG